MLELLAVKLALLTYLKDQTRKIIHLQIDNMTALSYLVKMGGGGGTRNQELIQISKEIWDFLLSRQITITAEYLPSSLNVIADWESRNHVDPSDWMLDPQVFVRLVEVRGLPEMDLFASCLNHQLEKYISWRPDPNSVGTDALQHRWDNLYCYAFPPFCLVAKILKKVAQEGAVLLLVTPTWQTQPWYSTLLAMSIQNPILLPMRFQVLTNPQGQTHPLVKQKRLRLAAWTVSGNLWHQRDYQSRLQILSQIPDAEAQYLITNRPGEVCAMTN